MFSVNLQYFPLLFVHVMNTVIDPTNSVGVLDPVCYGGNPSLPGSVFLLKHVIGWTVPTTLCRINEPPKGKDVNVIITEDRTNRRVVFELERDVYVGEEFYIDYGMSYDRSMYNTGSPNDSL